MLFLYLVQTPAPVYNIKVASYKHSARVMWTIPTPKDSSYITKIIIYLNGSEYKNISRGTQINIKGLKLYTWYQVEIEAEDSSSQRSNKVSIYFETNEAGKYKRKIRYCRFQVTFQRVDPKFIANSPIQKLGVNFATKFASVFQCLNFVCISIVIIINSLDKEIFIELLLIST